MSGPVEGFHAVLLAAGAGSRFGGRKLLAPWHGEPLVRAAARTALAAPVDHVVAVTGSDADLVEEALGGLVDLDGLGGTPGRCRVAMLGQDLAAIVAQRVQQVGNHVPRSDGVDADAVGRRLDG